MSGLGRNNLIDRSPSFSDSPDDSDESIQESWVEWWTHLKGNEFLCEVSEEFLRDEFNLYGFSSQVILLKFSLLAVDVPNLLFGAIIALSSFGFHHLRRFLSILTPLTSSLTMMPTSTTKS